MFYWMFYWGVYHQWFNPPPPLKNNHPSNNVELMLGWHRNRLTNIKTTSFNVLCLLGLFPHTTWLISTTIAVLWEPSFKDNNKNII